MVEKLLGCGIPKKLIVKLIIYMNWYLSMTLTAIDSYKIHHLMVFASSVRMIVDTKEEYFQDIWNLNRARKYE